MRARAVIIDTNVLVAGFITRDQDAPTAVIVDGMLMARFPYLLSIELLAEYRAVLLRPKIRKYHHLKTGDIDAVLTHLAANGTVRDPVPPSKPAPDPKDNHLWA